MGDSKSDNTQFCSFSILEKRVLQTLLLEERNSIHGLSPTSILKLVLGDWGAVSWVRKNWWRNFSITGKKAPGILLLMNQFHNLFAVFMIFLYEEVHPQTRFFAVTCLAHAGYLSFRRVFGEMGPKKPKKFHNW